MGSYSPQEVRYHHTLLDLETYFATLSSLEVGDMLEENVALQQHHQLGGGSLVLSHQSLTVCCIYSLAALKAVFPEIYR